MKRAVIRQAVIDASVAAKWVVEEEYSDRAVPLLDCEACHAPGHWRAEAVNVLWSKVAFGDLTEEDAAERMTALMQAPITDTPVSLLMPRAFAIAVALNVTVYDALYVALAEARGIPLVSADDRMVRRVSNDTKLAKLMVRLADLTPGLGGPPGPS